MSKTIAILRTGGAGDVILSTVAINVVYDLAPGSRILWFGREPLNTLVRDAFPGVEVFELAHGNSYRSNMRVVRSATKNADVVIDLQRSARTMILGAVAALYFGCAYTTWNKYSIARSLLVWSARLRNRQRTGFWSWQRPLTNRHEAMARCTMRALIKVGVAVPEEKVYTPSLSAWKKQRTRSAAAICLGAKFAAKALPVSIVAKMIAEVSEDGNIDELYLLGDADQKENARILMTFAPAHITVADRCGDTTLTEAAEILAGCRYAIANDSGLAHLSEAVGTPVLMFFGPTHEWFGYRPHLPQSRALSAPIGCRPCSKDGNVQCRYGDNACATMLTDTQWQEHLNAMRHAG